MGGYACLCTVTTADLWKLGQVRPGSTLRFQRITVEDAAALQEHVSRYVEAVQAFVKNGKSSHSGSLLDFKPSSSPPSQPRLAETEADPSIGRPRVIFRRAGDRYILVEFGEEEVDLTVRARVHLFELEVNKARINGVISLAPCVRSTLVRLSGVVSLSREAEATIAVSV